MGARPVYIGISGNMNNVTSVTAELLRSGEYSDFTLVCEGQKFPIHKSIVCPQSSVIAAALKSEFQVLTDFSILGYSQMIGC